MRGTSNPKKRLQVWPNGSRDLALVAVPAGDVLPQAGVPSVMLRDQVLVNIPGPQCGAGAITRNLKRQSRRRVRPVPDPAEETLVVGQHDHLTGALG